MCGIIIFTTVGCHGEMFFSIFKRLWNRFSFEFNVKYSAKKTEPENLYKFQLLNFMLVGNKAKKKQQQEILLRESVAGKYQ